MPPKQSSGARARSQAVAAEDSSDAASSDPFASGDDEGPQRRRSGPATAANRHSSGAAKDVTIEKTIPQNLLTRILHDLFEKDATRVSRDANAAVGKYVDVFVREAIARTAVEKRSGFLEVFFFSAFLLLNILL